MTTNAAHLSETDSIARLVPGGAPALARLSDDELLANTRRLVGRSNQFLAALLVHLAEVETRGAHRTRRCASLYTYCIYELRFSEDAAARRSAAARFVKQFQVLLDAIANGELHLTGLLMIGPHLTPENQLEVLGRAKFRTKKELGKLIRDLNPLPGVPDCVQPLGPEPPRALRNPTWAEYVEALAPAVRELPQGERPRDWVNDGVESVGTTNLGSSADVDVPVDHDEALPVGPVPADLLPVTKPQHYQVQFSTTEEHARLIDRAKVLMARERPSISLGELHLEAMKLLVASLEKRKFAVGAKPRGGPAAARRQPQAPTVNEPPQRDTAEQRLQHRIGRPQRAISEPSHQLHPEQLTRQRGTGLSTHQPLNDDASTKHAVSQLSRPHDSDPPPRQRDSDPPPRQRDSDPPPRQRDFDQPPCQRGSTPSPNQQRDSDPPPRQRDSDPPPRQRGSTPSPNQQRGSDQPLRQRDSDPSPPEPPPRRRGGNPSPPSIEMGSGVGELNRRSAKASRRRSRHVAARERRTVYGRDGGRCTYVDARGERCPRSTVLGDTSLEAIRYGRRARSREFDTALSSPQWSGSRAGFWSRALRGAAKFG